jgi:hypothetical protein
MRLRLGTLLRIRPLIVGALAGSHRRMTAVAGLFKNFAFSVQSQGTPESLSSQPSRRYTPPTNNEVAMDMSQVIQNTSWRRAICDSRGKDEVMKTLRIVVVVAVFLAVGRTTSGQQAEPQAPVAPRFLSQTGLYSNAAKLKIDSRNRLFSPQFPLWSDGTSKRRWVRLPDGSQIDVAELGEWQLPVGTRFWKEFSINGRKVETRFLWQTSRDHWVLASYVWNNSQTDAELVSEDGIGNIAEVFNGAPATAQ